MHHGPDHVRRTDIAFAADDFAPREIVQASFEDSVRAARHQRAPHLDGEARLTCRSNRVLGRPGIHVRFDAEVFEVGHVEQLRALKIRLQDVRQIMPRTRHGVFEIKDGNRDFLDLTAGGVNKNFDGF